MKATSAKPSPVLLLAAGQFGEASHDPEPRRDVIESETKRIEETAFAGTGGATDGEKPGAAQRLASEIHRVRSGERGDVAEADAEDSHQAAAVRISRSAVSSAGSGSVP